MLKKYLYGSFLLYFVLVGFYYYGTKEHAALQAHYSCQELFLIYESNVGSDPQAIEAFNREYNKLRSQNGLQSVRTTLLKECNKPFIRNGGYYQEIVKVGEERFLHYTKPLLGDKEGYLKIFYPMNHFIKESNTLFTLLSFATFIVFAIIFSILSRFTKLSLRKEISLKRANKELANRILEIDKKDRILIKQSKLAAMGEMIAVIAHQLKQPLNSLNLMIEDIEDAYSYREINKSYIEEYQKNTKKKIYFMSRTIDDFRDFFKPNKSKESFNIKEAVEGVVEILGASLKRCGVRVNIVGEQQLCVMAVKGEFEQVVLNIINNAKDALFEKKIRYGVVNVDIINEKNSVKIEISDNAGGILKEHIEKIFDSYFSTKGDDGTGIGLYMSKMIVQDSLSGTLNVKNGDEGAVFTLVIPQTDSDA